jgi:hypothetical protein
MPSVRYDLSIGPPKPARSSHRHCSAPIGEPEALGYLVTFQPAA